MARFLSAVVIAATLVSCRTSREMPPAPSPENRQVSSPAPVNRTSPATLTVHSYADVVDRTSPAVVTIRSARRVRGPQQFPFFSDPFFERFFGSRPQRDAPQRQQLGLGSGVLVGDGVIVTNHHVIDGAEEITIDLQDRRKIKAELVGSDPPSDLAVLRVSDRNLPKLELGNSDDVRVGDVALAIGNPLGIGQTVTAGIISAKGRHTGLSDGSFEDFLQTDAPINRGNSGGALVNTAGQLIGINSQILSPTGANIGIGFAIPSNMTKHVMDQLLRQGKVRRGRLGVSTTEVTSDLAAKFGVTARSGALVAEVGSGTPAERAGIKAGDVITAVNGQEVVDSNALRNRISGSSPGQEVAITLQRGGREQQVRARLEEFRD